MSSETPPNPIVEIFNPAYWNTESDNNHSHPYVPSPDTPVANIHSITLQDATPLSTQILGGGGAVNNSIVQQLGNVSWTIPTAGLQNAFIQVNYNFVFQITNAGQLGTTQNNTYTDSGTLYINPNYLTTSFSNYEGFPTQGVIFQNRQQSAIYPTTANTWSNFTTSIYLKYDTGVNKISFFYVNRNDLCYNGLTGGNLQPESQITFSAQLYTDNIGAGSAVSLTEDETTTIITPTIIIQSSTGGNGNYVVPIGYNRMGVYAVGKGGSAGGGAYPDNGTWNTGGAGGGGGVALLNFCWIDPYTANTSYNYDFTTGGTGSAIANTFIIQGVAQSASLTADGTATNGASGTYSAPGALGGTGGGAVVAGTSGTPTSSYSQGTLWANGGGTGGNGSVSFNYASPVPAAGFPTRGTPPTQSGGGGLYKTGYSNNDIYGYGQSNPTWLGYTQGGYVDEFAGYIGNPCVAINLYPNW